MRHMTRIAITASAALCFGLTALLQAQTPLFEAAPPIAFGGGSGQLALVDINGDKHLDLVVHRAQQGIEVHLGNGRGEFSSLPSGPLNLGGIEPGSMALGDVTSDGQVDLVVAHKDPVLDPL